MDKITHDDVNEIVYTSFYTATEMMSNGYFKELINPLLDRLRADLGAPLPKSSPLAAMAIGYSMGFQFATEFYADQEQSEEQSAESSIYRIERKDTRHGKYGKLQYAIYTKGDFTDRELAAFDTIEAAGAAIRYLTGAPMQEDERQTAITALQAIDHENAEKEAKKTAERAARRAKKDATASK